MKYALFFLSLLFVIQGQINWCDPSWDITFSSCDDTQGYGCGAGKALDYTTYYGYIFGFEDPVSKNVTFQATWGWHNENGDGHMSVLPCQKIGVQPWATFFPSLANLVLPWQCGDTSGQYPNPVQVFTPTFSVTRVWQQFNGVTFVNMTIASRFSLLKQNWKCNIRFANYKGP